MLPNILRRKKKEMGSATEEEETFGAENDEEQKEPEDLAKDDVGEEEKPLRSALIEISKDVIIALIIVMIIVGGIYLYTGNWPPVVVVESNSMQHSDDESFLGVIDTGDLVLVKTIDGRNDVVSYMQGERIGHETYSEYGDVLIYQKNGYYDITPVIHRSILWVEYNETSGSFDVPELKHHGPDDWYVVGGEQRWYNLSGRIILNNIGYDHVNVNINLGSILRNFQDRGVAPHSGFITLGDHNHGVIDQTSLRDQHDRNGVYQGPRSGGMPVAPIKPEWIIGKARGELPWFGLIKLYVQDSTITERAPSNSWTMLIISIILIFAVPICIDIFLILLERRQERRDEEAEEGEGETEEDEGEGETEKEGELPPPPDYELPPPEDVMDEPPPEDVMDEPPPEDVKDEPPPPEDVKDKLPPPPP